MGTPLLELLSKSSRGQAVRHFAERLGLHRHRALAVFYDPAYRLPLAAVEVSTGVESRRADFAVWYLLKTGALERSELRTPRRAVYADLARVHSAEFLEALSTAETLASIFAVDPSDVPVDELLNTVRLACGATIEAARMALKRRGVAANLLGGFHHAFPDKAGGLCPVNDIAVAIAVLRSEGFSGKVGVIDLDAHPPDGTAACLGGDKRVWIGSLSGSAWLPLEGVDETVLPGGCPDDKYIRALNALLGRMPALDLAFVIAGGDVLGSDRMGRLGLSLHGARRRDLRVAEALEGIPSVWLAGGGYHRDSWKVLAGTLLALKWRSREQIPVGFDPMRAHYSEVWKSFGREQPGDLELTAEDLDESLGVYAPQRRLLLGAFTAESIELAMHHCNILNHLQRLGYGHFHVEIDEGSPGERMRLFGEADGVEHVLLECVVERKRIADSDVLYVHWMTLRNPKAQFSERRPQLPGQELPGLGVSRETGETLARMAKKLGMQAVVFRPAWYHMAFTSRYHFQYLDPKRQGRFEAILRDFARVPLREATLAFVQGRVRMNGGPYSWESDEMAYWLDDHKVDRKAIKAERNRVHFSLVPVRGARAKPSRRAKR
mgnify:CR=1 FL=1